MQMATFAINYKVLILNTISIYCLCILNIQTHSIACCVRKGHPFMESLSENRPLLWSIALSGLAIVGLLTGSSPEFNEQFALVDIPTEVS